MDSSVKTRSPIVIRILLGAKLVFLPFMTKKTSNHLHVSKKLSTFASLLSKRPLEEALERW